MSLEISQSVPVSQKQQFSPYARGVATGVLAAGTVVVSAVILKSVSNAFSLPKICKIHTTASRIADFLIYHLSVSGSIFSYTGLAFGFNKMIPLSTYIPNITREEKVLLPIMFGIGAGVSSAPLLFKSQTAGEIIRYFAADHLC